MGSYYEILGVARDASEEEIRFAYRRRSKECHPDLGGSTEKMADLNAAKDTLLDRAKRAAYDSGAAAPPDTTDVGLEAKNLLFVMFDAVLEHAPEQNPIEAVNFFLDQHIGEFQDKLRTLQARIAKFRHVAARVLVKKKGGDNLFAYYTERKIDGLQPEMAQYELVITISKLARELVNQMYTAEESVVARKSKTFIQGDVRVAMTKEYMDFFKLTPG